MSSLIKKIASNVKPAAVAAAKQSSSQVSANFVTVPYEIRC